MLYDGALGSDKANGFRLSVRGAQQRNFPAHPRKHKLVEFKKKKLKWDLEEPIFNYLCVPKSATNPLFDAFFVEVRCTKSFRKATIWVVQATISDTHNGSKEGYPLLHSIADVVRKQMASLKPCPPEKPPKKKLKSMSSAQSSVNFHYVYACPLTTGECIWYFEKSDSWEGLQGQVFCMKLDMAVRPSMFPMSLRLALLLRQSLGLKFP